MLFKLSLLICACQVEDNVTCGRTSRDLKPIPGGGEWKSPKISSTIILTALHVFVVSYPALVDFWAIYTSMFIGSCDKSTLPKIIQIPPVCNLKTINRCYLFVEACIRLSRVVITLHLKSIFVKTRVRVLVSGTKQGFESWFWKTRENKGSSLGLNGNQWCDTISSTRVDPALTGYTEKSGEGKQEGRTKA